MTDANLDLAALALLQALAQSELCSDARTRLALDRALCRLQTLAARRIRSLVVRLGLDNLGEDAEQICLIGLVEAARRWDPARGSFATWMGWHLRGMLVGLRRQWMGDQRTQRGRQRAATLSLDMLNETAGAADWLVDPDAEQNVMRGASDWLAQRCAERIAAVRKAPSAASSAASTRGRRPTVEAIAR